MTDGLINVLMLAAFVLCVSGVGVLYCRNEKKREERRIMERKSDADRDPHAAINKMAMHSRYNGLSTRGRIN